MLEKDLYKYIKKAFNVLKNDKYIKNYLLTRVENTGSDGLPDYYVCVDGIAFWLEAKSPVVKKKVTTPIFGGSHKITSNQLAWLKANAKAGGKGFVMVANERLCLLLDGAKVDTTINSMSLSSVHDYDSCMMCFEYDKTSRPCYTDFLVFNLRLFLGELKRLEKENKDNGV